MIFAAGATGANPDLVDIRARKYKLSSKRSMQRDQGHSFENLLESVSPRSHDVGSFTCSASPNNTPQQRRRPPQMSMPTHTDF